MAENQEVYWIWLNGLKGLNNLEKRKMVEQWGSPMAVYNYRKAMDLDANLERAARIHERHGEIGVKMITPGHSKFKAGMPVAVYYLGNLADGPSIAVVGTRHCSADGYYSTKNVCETLTAKGFCINSGLAKGVDRHAHTAAIVSGGKTQAFVAHGLDLCYPKENKGLMRQIAEQGAVISIFAAGEPPMKHHFLKRNNFMALWSDGVIVIEAGRKSGALDTAFQAFKYGKQVWAIQGPAHVSKCEGNMKLLQKGAKPYHVKRAVWNEPETRIIQALRAYPKTMQHLSHETNMDYNNLDAVLYNLECRHWVVLRADGKWHYNGW